MTDPAAPAHHPHNAARHPRPRHVSPFESLVWLKAGWFYFARNPGVWVAISVIFIIMLFVLGLVPLLGWAVVLIGFPVMVAGMVLAYVVLPYGLQVLFGFTPEGVENIVSVDRYLSFFIRTVLVFGVGFLVPLLLVLLNFAGVLSGRRLLSWWRWIIVAVVVFAAVATPTGDPINLMLLAGPILVLVALAVGVSLLNDRRRRRRARRSGDLDYSQYGDDDITPIDPATEI